MSANGLSVASPRVRANSKGGGQAFRHALAQAPPPGAEGVASEFIEIYVYLMTADSWELLWTLFHTPTNPFAWGYDMWLPQYGRQQLAAQGTVYKQGIVSTLQSVHVQGEVQADNSGTKRKWQGVLAQEVFYKQHLGIDLKRFRSGGSVKSEGTLASPSTEYMSSVRTRREEQMWIPTHVVRSTGFPIYGSLQQHSLAAEKIDRPTQQQLASQTSSTIDAVAGRGLVLVPDMATAEHASAMVENLKRLESNLSPSGGWDCVIYVTAVRGQGDIWAAREARAALQEACFVIEEPGAALAYALHATQPCYLASAYSHVFVLRAGLRLVSGMKGTDAAHSRQQWDLQNLLDVMAFNDLTVVSPAIDGELMLGQGELMLSDVERTAMADVMAVAADANRDGVESAYVELAAVLFTMDAFRSFWELVHPSSNPNGQGLALWYDQYCRKIKRANTHKMGIVSGLRAARAKLAEVDDIAPVLQAKRQEGLYQYAWEFPLETYRKDLLASKIVRAQLSRAASNPRWQLSAPVTRTQQMRINPALARVSRSGPAAAKRAFEQK